MLTLQLILWGGCGVHGVWGSGCVEYKGGAWDLEGVGGPWGVGVQVVYEVIRSKIGMQPQIELERQR